MTKYVYRVVSNKPLELAVGVGNMPHIFHSEYGANIFRRDDPRYSESNGSAASVGLEIGMELIERNER